MQIRTAALAIILLSLPLTSCGKTGILTHEECLETVNREVDFMRPYIATGGFPGITNEDQLRESRMQKCKQPDTWYDQEYKACILGLPPPGYKAMKCSMEALRRRKARSS
jgi:hypothetical protein